MWRNARFWPEPVGGVGAKQRMADTSTPASRFLILMIGDFTYLSRARYCEKRLVNVKSCQRCFGVVIHHIFATCASANISRRRPKHRKEMTYDIGRIASHAGTLWKLIEEYFLRPSR